MSVRVATLEMFEELERRVVELERVLEARGERWLTVEDAASYTGRSAKAIRHLYAKNRIPGHKPEGRLIFSTRELDGWMRAQ